MLWAVFGSLHFVVVSATVGGNHFDNDGASYRHCDCSYNHVCGAAFCKCMGVGTGMCECRGEVYVLVGISLGYDLKRYM